jgi:hypothetical protein
MKIGAKFFGDIGDGEPYFIASLVPLAMGYSYDWN